MKCEFKMCVKTSFELLQEQNVKATSENRGVVKHYALLPTWSIEPNDKMLLDPLIQKRPKII